MTFFRLISASLRYHWRTNLAVACGVAVGAAVLTGALLVGDSMRGSLRHLTLTGWAASTRSWWPTASSAPSWPTSWRPQPGFARCAAAAVPADPAPRSLENADPQSPARANQVN